MYDRAIVREPSQNFPEGLTTRDLGKSNYEKALEQHESYISALERCGVQVEVLEPLENYPDSCFVEDTSVLGKDFCILTNPGHQSRNPEPQLVQAELTKHFSDIDMVETGSIDGGDVVRVDDNFFIGISSRTDNVGAAEMASKLGKRGYKVNFIPVKSVLHLTTGLSYLGDGNVLTIDEFSGRKELEEFDVYVVDEDEKYAANALRVNGKVLMAKGYPKTKKKVESLGYDVLEVPMSEFKKQDGSLTCLSLLF